MLGGVEVPELEDVSVTCSATPPYAVTSASADWHQLCGFAEHEVVGKTLVLIQGPATQHDELRTMMASLRAGEVPEPVTLINYDKQNQPFVHTVTISALTDESGAITHFHARSSDIALLNRKAHGPIDALSVDKPLVSVGSAADRVLSIICQGETVQRSPACPQWGVHEVVTQATHPFAVVHASPSWLYTCGFRLDEVVGNTLRCIQGVATDAAVVAELMRACRAGVAIRDARVAHGGDQVVEGRSLKRTGARHVARVAPLGRAGVAIHGLQLVNYDKSKSPFMHELSVEPVIGAGGEAFLRATSRNVRRLTEGRDCTRLHLGSGDRAADLTKLARMELEDKPAEQHSFDNGLGAMRLRHRLPRTAWAISTSGGQSREWHLASYELNSSQSLPPSSASSICSHTSMSSSSLTREQYCY